MGRTAFPRIPLGDIHIKKGIVWTSTDYNSLFVREVRWPSRDSEVINSWAVPDQNDDYWHPDISCSALRTSLSEWTGRECQLWVLHGCYWTGIFGCCSPRSCSLSQGNVKGSGDLTLGPLSWWACNLEERHDSLCACGVGVLPNSETQTHPNWARIQMYAIGLFLRWANKEARSMFETWDMREIDRKFYWSSDQIDNYHPFPIATIFAVSSSSLYSI